MKKNLITKKKNQNGFTLVELIVVVAIIGVLVAMMVPSLIGYVNKAKVQKNNANARTIASVVQASNVTIDKPIKGAETNAVITRVGKGDWSGAGVDADSLKELNDDSKEMISIDGSAHVEIDKAGKVVKVIYSTISSVPDADATGPDDEMGIWVQTDSETISPST